MLAVFLLFNSLNSSAAYQLVQPCETLHDFEYCEFTIEGYPEPIAVLSPKDAVSSVRLHWHGYILDPNSAFDKSLKSYIETLSLYPSVNGERVIIPKSTGKCETYFKNVSSLQKFIQNLSDWIPEDSPIKISGHSGAGAFLANLLVSEEIKNMTGIHLVDALYSENSASMFQKWKQAHASIEMSVSYVKGSATEKYSEALLSNLKDDKSVRSYPLITAEPWLEIDPHYFILKNVWPFL